MSKQDSSQGGKIKHELTNKKRDVSSMIRHALSYLFSFLLAIFLLVLSAAGIMGFVLSEKYMVMCLNDSYYEGLLQDVENSVKDFTEPTGLNSSITEGIFEVDTIKRDVNAYIENTFKIRQYTLDTSVQEDRLRSKTIEYLNSQGVPTELVDANESETELDEDSVKEYNASVKETIIAVDEYVSDIMEVYRREIKLAGLDYLARVGNEYRKYLPYIMLISGLFTVIFSILCMRLHKLPHRGLRFLVYGFGGGFLMTFLAPFIVYISGFYNKISVTPEYFKQFIIAYVKGTLAGFMIVSQVWLLIALLLLIPIILLRKKSLRKRKK